jgi:hypothetical protein
MDMANKIKKENEQKEFKKKLFLQNLTSMKGKNLINFMHKKNKSKELI